MSEVGNGGPDSLESRQDAPGSTNGSQTNGSSEVIKKAAKNPSGYVLLKAKDGKPTGQFAKGSPGGPGRPPGKRDFFAELIRDLERVEGAEKKSFLRHRWQRAFRNDSVAADMMSYLLPKPKPADHTEPPDLSFTGPAQVNVIQHAEITFTGNGDA